MGRCVGIHGSKQCLSGNEDGTQEDTITTEEKEDGDFGMEQLFSTNKKLFFAQMNQLVSSWI